MNGVRSLLNMRGMLLQRAWLARRSVINKRMLALEKTGLTRERTRLISGLGCDHRFNK